MLPDSKGDDGERVGSRGGGRDSKDEGGGQPASRHAADAKDSSLPQANKDKVRKIHNSSSPSSLDQRK